MPEYIDREKYCAEVCRCNKEKCDKSKCPVWNAPAADVAPVVHGKWIDTYKNFETAECSSCHSQFEVTFGGESNGALWDGFKSFYKYCPNCGAKMNLEEDE